MYSVCGWLSVKGQRVNGLVNPPPGSFHFCLTDGGVALASQLCMPCLTNSSAARAICDPSHPFLPGLTQPLLSSCKFHSEWDISHAGGPSSIFLLPLLTVVFCPQVSSSPLTFALTIQHIHIFAFVPLIYLTPLQRWWCYETAVILVPPFHSLLWLLQSHWHSSKEMQMTWRWEGKNIRMLQRFCCMWKMLAPTKDLGLSPKKNHQEYD